MTNDDIEALMYEARDAGDNKMVIICFNAMYCGGPDGLAAREECIRVITDERKRREAN